MEFRILGPIEVLSGGARLRLGGARQRAVLAALLVDANRVVSVDRLIGAVWDERPPSTARHQIRMSVSALRRAFVEFGAHQNVITTRSPGYLLGVEQRELDSWAFESGVRAARSASGEGDLTRAVAQARKALSLWRGPACDGIPGHAVQAEAARLEERRISLIEDCLQWELALGHHHDVVGELTALTSEYPLRERFHRQLMLALYRDGRQAEALAAYSQAREAFQRDLGLDPGTELQQLQRAILAHDPGLMSSGLELPSGGVRASAARARPTPRQLRRDVDDFTGRHEELGRVINHLVRDRTDQTSMPITVIAGQGGVGKTTFAVHAAHAVTDAFPDGQLYANLGESQVHPAEPAGVLARFLRALGVPGAAMPDATEERAELYRSYLAGSRMMVVLDNAVNEAQVSPLLPGAPSCGVLITSRSRMTGLSGAQLIELDVLERDTARELLCAIASRARVDAEPDAASDVVDLCGRLPLAIRIAGAKLAARPHWTVAQLADRLRDRTRRLDELTHGELSVRANITLSYETLGPRARSLFRMFGVLDALDLTSSTAAALLDTSVAEASDLLDQLVDCQLVQVTGRDEFGNRYRCHDLVHAYARDCGLREDPQSSRHAALVRAASALLATAEHARRGLSGGNCQTIRSEVVRWMPEDLVVDRLARHPLDWFETERRALVSIVRQMRNAGQHELCWDLAVTAATHFQHRAYYDDWLETHQNALAATNEAGDLRGQAAALTSLGELRLSQGRFDDAADHCAAAQELFRRTGESHGVAVCQVRLAHIARRSGRYDDAQRGYDEALVLIRELGNRGLEACVLRSLGQMSIDRGDLVRAQSQLRDAMTLAEKTGNLGDLAQVHYRIGRLHLRRDELEEADVAFVHALGFSRRLGDSRGEAAAMCGVGATRIRLGQFEQADAILGQALQTARDMENRVVQARALFELGLLQQARGRLGSAADFLEEAAGIYRELGGGGSRAECLLALGDVYQSSNSSDRAVAAWTASAELFGVMRSPRMDEVSEVLRAMGDRVA